MKQRGDGGVPYPPGDTVSFHNFKSQNFKLSVSNPKHKYVAYVDTLHSMMYYDVLCIIVIHIIIYICLYIFDVHIYDVS